jgi:hypothetical protein
MIEPIAVETYLNKEGEILPRAFIWQGQRYSIYTWGRRWKEGDEEHTLVITQGELSFELAYSSLNKVWTLIRKPQDFGTHKARV